MYMAPTVLLVLMYMAPTVLLVLTTASVLLFLTYTAATASHRPMVRVAANHSQLSENILYVLRDRCTQLAVTSTNGLGCGLYCLFICFRLLLHLFKLSANPLF